MSMTSFEYVVEKVQPQKVCFMSAKERGLYDKPKKEKWCCGPYNLEKSSALYKLLNKVRSKRGVPGLCDKTPRWKTHFEETPGPVIAHSFIDFRKELTKFPFGSRLPRFLDRYPSTTPGPGTYNTSKKCKTTVMCQTFGGPRMMYPAVDTICVSRPSHKCERCREICNGDYWHLDENIFMCSICMIIERHDHKMYKKQQLVKFQPMRNCSFMHSHEGTEAAIRLIPQKLIVLKQRKENYLNLFIDPY